MGFLGQVQAPGRVRCGSRHCSAEADTPSSPEVKLAWECVHAKKVSKEKMKSRKEKKHTETVTCSLKERDFRKQTKTVSFSATRQESKLDASSAKFTFAKRNGAAESLRCNRCLGLIP